MPLFHSSTRRPAPLQDADYDHRIILIDQSRQLGPESSRSPTAARQLSSILTKTPSSRKSGAPLHKHGSTLKQDWARHKWSKQQGARDNGAGDDATSQEVGEGPVRPEDQDEGSSVDGEDRGRTRKKSLIALAQEQPESVIDILYENQRGGFLCGIPLFSSRALGNLDPAPWTNSAFKTSATNPTTAQVPDPSWEWAWKDWSVNKTEEVDEDGWEYSFAFSRRFSWHSQSWWNSFVRRRAWLRKRVKKHPASATGGPTMLSENYFTIHPAHTEDLSRSRASSADGAKDRYSLKGLAKRQVEDGELVSEDIKDIKSLMNVLRFSRIDREKLEAVESFIRHGDNDLEQLEGHMHDIMMVFIFQASRRILLAHLIRSLEEQSDNDEASSQSNGKKESLHRAVEAAEQEVRKLEFWSDGESVP